MGIICLCHQSKTQGFFLEKSPSVFVSKRGSIGQKGVCMMGGLFKLGVGLGFHVGVVGRRFGFGLAPFRMALFRGLNFDSGKGA